jgi:hypothetical protein
MADRLESKAKTKTENNSNYKKWKIREYDIRDEEILYRVDKRNIFYILGGDLAVVGVSMLMSIPMLIGENTTILLMCIGLILFIYGMHSFMSTITFNELIITKKKIIVRRFFIKDECIYINNIKRIETTSHLLINDLVFVCKNERMYASILGLNITGLYDKDLYKIEEIIKTLQQEQNNGKQ